MKKHLTDFRKNNFGRSPLALAAIVLLALFGTVSITYGIAIDANESNIAKSVTPKLNTSPSSKLSSGLDRSEPTFIQLPSINVSSSTVQLENNADGTVEVPSGENEEKVGWYKYSSAPGEIGSSVFLGHYDSKTGPSIFFRLQELSIGDPIIVKRADGSQVKFDVTSVERYPKNQFPTSLVYGSTDDKQIRLVTCGGEFNGSTNDYEDNIVVLGKISK